MLVAFAQVMPLFAVVAYFSSLEKALVVSTIVWAIWIAVSMRKEGWHKPGFWWIVALVAAVNAVAVWAVPINEQFEAGMAVAYPLGMLEGFAVYWLLGWWLRREEAH